MKHFVPLVQILSKGLGKRKPASSRRSIPVGCSLVMGANRLEKSKIGEDAIKFISLFSYKTNLMWQLYKLPPFKNYHLFDDMTTVF